AKYPCRACGLEQGVDMWNPPSHAICPCCSIEMGLQDNRLREVRYYRRKWLINGGKWFIEAKQPDRWTINELTEQLSNIPIEWWYRDDENHE
ncbi:MAG: hypothetical protein AAFN11_15685, partial [Chloroflexota bacterium]